MKNFRSEQIIWKDRPSQIQNIGYFFSCLLLSFLLIPILLMLWRWLQTRFTVYKLTDQRFILSQGVFNKVVNQLELYRIRDYRQEQPFLLRIFGLSNIVLISNDRTDKIIYLYAIYNGAELINQIRYNVEILRSTKSRII